MLSSLEKRLSLLYHRGRNESERRDKKWTAFHHRQSRHRQNPPLHRGNHPSIEYGSETADSHCARAVHLAGGTRFDCRNRQNAILTAEVLSFGRPGASGVLQKDRQSLPLRDIRQGNGAAENPSGGKGQYFLFPQRSGAARLYRPAGSDHFRIFSVPHFSGEYGTLAQAEGLS